jgi:hypothetical protein
MSRNLKKSTNSAPQKTSQDLNQMCQTCMRPRTSDARIGVQFFSSLDTHQESCDMIGALLIDCIQLRLNLHLKDHKFRELGKTVSCPEPGCSMMFYIHKPYQLQRHKRIHTGVTYYGCEICPKTFVDYTGEIF